MKAQEFLKALVRTEYKRAVSEHIRHKENFERCSTVTLDDDYGDSGTTYAQVLQGAMNHIDQLQKALNWLEGGEDI